MLTDFEKLVNEFNEELKEKDKKSSENVKEIPNPRTKRAFQQFLKETTNQIQFGEKENGRFWQTTKEGIVKNYNYSRFYATWNRQDLNRHLDLNDDYTLYYAGRSNSYSLVMIDIDVLKKQNRGSTEGAIKLIEFIKKYLFRNIYWEPSTNGKGIHGYFILNTIGKSEEEINRSLKYFQEKLRELNDWFHIEQVEIKGTCPLMWFCKKNYKWEKTRIDYVQKLGQLAKLPRDESRFEELKNTDQVTIDELNNFNYEKLKNKLPKNPKYKIDIVVNTKIKKKASDSASIDGVPFKDEDLVNLANGSLVGFLKDIIPQDWKTGYGQRVKDIDLACAIVIIAFCTLHPNKDGSLPTNRAKALWGALYEKGMTDRKWEHHRWKTVRDWLSLRDFLVIKNDFYFRPPTESQREKGLFGKAARWHGTQELMDLAFLDKLPEKKFESKSMDLSSPVFNSILTERKEHLCGSALAHSDCTLVFENRTFTFAIDLSRFFDTFWFDCSGKVPKMNPWFCLYDKNDKKSFAKAA